MEGSPICIFSITFFYPKSLKCHRFIIEAIGRRKVIFYANYLLFFYIFALIYYVKWALYTVYILIEIGELAVSHEQNNPVTFYDYLIEIVLFCDSLPEFLTHSQIFAMHKFSMGIISIYS